MAAITAQQAGGANRVALLNTVAVSEIGAALLANPITDDGYKVLVGATPDSPLVFDSFAAHPDVLNKALNSTAAGRYQILYRYWLVYKQQLNLPDFGPLSQDKIALQMMRETGALPFIDAGNLTKAVQLCASRWASLPGAGYGQHVNTMTQMIGAFTAAGGQLARTA